MSITPLKRQILKNINLCSNIHKQHKTNILQTLIEQNKDLAPQGSLEWLTMRECSIGGSEMSIITGDNCFSKLDTLIAQKIAEIKNISIEQVAQITSQNALQIFEN